MPHQRFPKVQILHMAPHEIKFILSETDTSMANTLRRIMIAEVPTMAIDLVEFHDNTTVLNDEYIAHRLGLIPIRYQPPNSMKGGDCTTAFSSHRDCTCYERCHRCAVDFELDVNFDEVLQQHSEDGFMTVTSQDLKSSNEAVTPAHFLNQDEQDVAQDAGIAIVKMRPGQRLKFKAVARRGIGKEHAKWSPVAVVTYRFWPIVTVNEEQVATLTMEQKQELINVCPDQILELDDVTGSIKAVDNYWDIATYTDDMKDHQASMKKRKEDDDFITIQHSTDKFIFTVESTGVMDADEIVMSGLRVLKDRLTYLANEVENLKDI